MPNSTAATAVQSGADVPSWMTFWGKARPDADRSSSYPPYHPVAFHLLDVAATVGAILDARPATLARGARLLGIAPAVVRRLLVALAGLHDVGKFAPAFQSKVEEHWPGALGAYYEPASTPHTSDGYALWHDCLRRSLGERIWPGGRLVLAALAPAVFGHHGRPISTKPAPAAAVFGRGALNIAVACAEEVSALLLPEPITGVVPDERRVGRASWWVSGILTLADWVGSRQDWFEYESPSMPLGDYWVRAQDRARIAVRLAGLGLTRPASKRGFVELTGIPTPSPAQKWAERVPLPDGPALVILEDVTGAGKTEAAQMLVHQFMTREHATGAYWAMPTQATANAMYTRQGGAIKRLYAVDEDSQPSLALAHGQARLHARFRASVLDARGQSRLGNGTRPAGPEFESGAACAAFLADDRRAALMADVGAGTIDQAVLGVLPSRFNTMRLLGLSDKVLVLDEAHAYDAYVAQEVQALLRFHAALGGSAVVLSATLSRRQRQELVAAWVDGSSAGARVTTPQVHAEQYPLATVVDGAATTVREDPIKAAKRSRRTVPVRFVHTEREAEDWIVEAHQAGAASCWVRNTVRDCLAAAEALRARRVPVLVFHARFAQGDRQRRERLVARLFGKAARTARRRGRVLVATQVVEQSLDLDFDALVSDVAPVDLLIQRAGRLWRHDFRDEARRAAGLRRELVVLAPPFEDEPQKHWISGLLPGTAAVYPDAGVLWRTVRALQRPVRALRKAGGIITPGRVGEVGSVRNLIDAVYGDDTTPAALQPAADRAIGASKAAGGVAQYVVLDVNDGYHGATKGWVDDIRATTRLGGDQTTIRLARVDAGRRLAPWVAGGASDPAWKAWALSEVRVSIRRVPPGAGAPSDHTSAIEALRGEWGRFEQDIPVLPLTDTAIAGEWAGTLIAPSGASIPLRYTLADGLLLP